jgi:replication factor C subunit 3/5
MLCSVKFQPLAIWSKTLVPDNFSDFIANSTIRKILHNYATSKLLPNVLLTGSHGTCKKNFAVLTAKLYLEEDYEKGCLHIDGAVSRGKDIISSHGVKKASEKTGGYTGLNVMEFSKIRMTLKNGVKRIVIIYNFEDMTVDAQNALRRIMETQAGTTRFILVSNSIDNIIEAIQSRCITLHTDILTDEETIELIYKIREKTGTLDATWENDISPIIAMLSDGDMRKIVNYIQVISALPVKNVECFHKVFNIPHIKLLTSMLDNGLNVATQERVLHDITFILKQGYAYSDILEMLSKIIPRHTSLPLELRVRYLEILTRYYCGITPHINVVHLYSLFAEFAHAATGTDDLFK